MDFDLSTGIYTACSTAAYIPYIEFDGETLYLGNPKVSVVRNADILIISDDEIEI
jgi:hypothetical protein